MISSWEYEGRPYHREWLIHVGGGFRLVMSLWSGIHTFRDRQTNISA